MIDGCTRVRRFFRITFPLLAPGLVATGVFGFIQAWNEFTLALVVMTRDGQADPAGVADARSPTSTAAPTGARIMAGSTLIADPGHRLLPARPGPDGQRASPPGR